MLNIPLQPFPNQSINVNLAGQNSTIDLYQREDALYCNLFVNGALIIGGVICENLNRIVRDLYLGFVGDIGFFDTQGVSNPDYAGLGTRFLLIYLEASDLDGAG